ncbi:MAG: sulfatase [Anaerolineae bacterium]|nr:sulfatase [Anaerolineae bacterium]
MTTQRKLTGPEYTATRYDTPTPLTATPPNIILINSDTYRYDNLFKRAALPVHTPNLDAFASERAVSMSHFYTGSFPTIPERTDLISGRYSWPWYGWRSLIQENKMPKLLNQHAYVTQLLCDCPHLFNSNFHQTFNGAYQVRGQEGDTYFLRMNDPIQKMMPREKTRTGHHFQDKNLVDLHRWMNRYWVCEEESFPYRTAAQAVRWLEENYTYSPFLLWVDFFDPHEPWDPPEYMVKKYDPDYDGIPMLHPNYGKASDYTAEELHNLRAHYCAEAELIDRWVGRIFEKIDDLGLWENSIVIFTTDHGMSLGEHDRTGKSNINDSDDRRWPLYPEIAHIPFLIVVPGMSGAREVELLAQPADILPTLLDLAGLDITPPDPFHGHSFAPALRGEAQPPLREVAICASHLRKYEGAIPATAVTPVLYTKQWAYAPIGPYSVRELYDLSRDPYAETNCAAEHPNIVETLHTCLIEWLRNINAPEEAIEVFTET